MSCGDLEYNTSGALKGLEYLLILSKNDCYMLNPHRNYSLDT